MPGPAHNLWLQPGDPKHHGTSELGTTMVPTLDDVQRTVTDFLEPLVSDQFDVSKQDVVVNIITAPLPKSNDKRFTAAFASLRTMVAVLMTFVQASHNEDIGVSVLGAAISDTRSEVNVPQLSCLLDTLSGRLIQPFTGLTMKKV